MKISTTIFNLSKKNSKAISKMSRKFEREMHDENKSFFECFQIIRWICRGNSFGSTLLDTGSSIREILGGKCCEIERRQFWTTKVNDAHTICGNDSYGIFRMLLRLLEQSKEPLVLCVAAHDVGEYVRHYPHGKKYVACVICRSRRFHGWSFRAIDKLEGKVIIMRLLENPDPNVRYQGLLCVQKLMVHNW